MEYQNENFNGEYDFRSRPHDGWTVRANLHEYSELLYCKEGAGRVIINGRSIDIKKGQLVWIPPNYIHQYQCPDAQVNCAVFSNDFVPLFFKERNGRYFCVTAVDVGELSEILDIIYTLDKNDRCTVSGWLNLICAKVMKQSSFEDGRHTDGALYQKVISYMADNFTENISLTTIANMFGYNEKYLSHTLHELTGVHFRQLLNFYRIRYAKELLANCSEKDITTVAMRCGFSSTNTFYRAFKESVGITPLEYRRVNGIK